MDLMKAIGVRITELCEKNGFSIQQLSERSGVCESLLTEITEGDIDDIEVVEIARLCKAYKITLDQFFKRDYF